MSNPAADPANRTRAARRRAAALAVIVAIQALSAVFFVADVANDLRWAGLGPHSGFEAFVALTLIVGVIFGAILTRQTLHRIQRAEAGITAASGAFAELIEERFIEWRLTPAEADVALFALKGLDVKHIAALRNAAAGTVRAQLTSVYAKARVSNRGQLTSLFIEDLLAAPLAGPEIEPETGPAADPPESRDPAQD